MKTCLGLIFIFYSLSLSAEPHSGSKSATLFLRGRVPASTSVQWEADEHGKKPEVKFNTKATPKVEITSQKDHRKITISHP